MFVKRLVKLIDTRFVGYFSNEFFLKGLPEDFFNEEFAITRKQVNGIIIFYSLIISISLGLLYSFFDLLIGCSMFILFFPGIVLFFIQKIKRNYFTKLMELEKKADLICREMLFIFEVTYSLKYVVEYLARGDYPIVSQKFKVLLKRLNLGSSPEQILKSFALNQPSETIRLFILDKFLPIGKGDRSIKEILTFDTQRIVHSKFEIYLNQLEDKMSLFLAITTIIPIVIILLLIILGYLTINILLVLPFAFFLINLLTLEILKTGKISLAEIGD